MIGTGFKFNQVSNLVLSVSFKAHLTVFTCLGMFNNKQLPALLGEERSLVMCRLDILHFTDQVYFDLLRVFSDKCFRFLIT